MSLYSGNSSTSADLVSKLGVSYDEIVDIVDQYIGPKIGELKFISHSVPYEDLGLQLIGDNVRVTGDFDGWTYPDGKNYYKGNFPAANDEYKSTDLADFFRVPLLQNFIKCNYSDIDKNQLYSPIAQNNDTLKHNHDLTKSGTLEMPFTIPDGFVYYAAKDCSTYETTQYYVGNDESGNKIYATVPKVHNGLHTSTKVPLPLNVKMTTSDLKTIFSSGLSKYPREIDGSSEITTKGEFQPQYFNMPVMIYIGKPVNKDYPGGNTFTVEFIYKDENYESKTYSTTVMEYNTAFPPNIPTLNGYIFQGWSSDEYQCVRRNLTGADAVLAQYSIQTYTVKFYYGIDNSLLKEVSVQYKQNALLDAPTDEQVKVDGMIFSGWSITTSELQSVERDITTYAQYAKKTYTVYDDSVNGKIDGAGMYEYNTVVTLQALPDAEYKFVKWEDNESIDPIREFTITSDIHLKAIFERKTIQSIAFYYDAIADSKVPEVSISGITITGSSRSYETQKTIQQYFDDIDAASKPSTFTYAYIEWGDGNSKKVLKESSNEKQSHEYSASGTYTMILTFVYIVSDKTFVSSDEIGFDFVLNSGNTCQEKSYDTAGIDLTDNCIQFKGKTYNSVKCKIIYTDSTFSIDDGLYPSISGEGFYFYKTGSSIKGVQFVKSKDIDLHITYIPVGSYDLYQDSSLTIKEGKIEILNKYTMDRDQKIYSFKELWFNKNAISKIKHDNVLTCYEVDIAWNS